MGKRREIDKWLCVVSDVRDGATYDIEMLKKPDSPI